MGRLATLKIDGVDSVADSDDRHVAALLRDVGSNVPQGLVEGFVFRFGKGSQWLGVF